MAAIVRFSGCGLLVLSSIVMGEICKDALTSPDFPTMVNNCDLHGLSEMEARALWADLSLHEAGFTEHARMKVKEYTARGVDIVPFLLGLRQSGAELGKATEIPQSTVVLWLALSHDERATTHLLATYRDLLRTRDDPYLLSRVTYSLGLTQSEAAVDLLFEVQGNAFWQDDSAPDLEQLEKCEDSPNFHEEAFINDVREMAIRALANTGSDRVIQAFGTYEGIDRSQWHLADGLFRMAIESKDTLPDVEKWREKGLPERKIVEMQALIRWWQKAEEYGVELPHAKVLLHDLEQLASEALVREREVYYRENDVEIVPFLIHLVESGTLPESGGGAVGSIAEDTVLFWIAALGGEASGEYLLNQAQELMRGSITSRLQLGKVQKLMRYLGMTRYEAALDYLFKVQGDDFWESPDAPAIELPASVHRSVAQEKEDAVGHIQVSALQGLAASGTERVIHAFGTGQGVNPAYRVHSDRFFKAAARAHFDIVGMPEWYGQPLPEETLNGLQELYARYGKTYVPEQEREDVQRQSDPSQ